MTGRYNVRNYAMFGMLDKREVTFGQLLKKAGYVTCIAGKWQLGQDPELPKTTGFDEHCLWQHLRRPPRYANPGLEINGVRVSLVMCVRHSFLSLSEIPASTTPNTP
jgi:arylsulfatase A